MPLKIYDSLRKELVEFKPIKAGEVSLYVCGLTVYDQAHIGHVRMFMVFDTIRRALEFKGFKVKHVCNHTDVDDKIIRRANENHEDPRHLADRMIETLERDIETLHIQKPHLAPRVTTHIPQIIAITQTLIDKGFAYVSGGDVWYSVDKFVGYGKLSGKNIDDLKAGESGRVSDTDTAKKKNPLDFALWKSAKVGEPETAQWDSPWGKGRPGWHIECSAMSEEHLGTPFDIHGGGKDLIFPHHENEIAQSEAANGKTLANYWMHNGYLNSMYEDEVGKRHFVKMSKSLGNYYTVEEVMKRHDFESYRYSCLGVHYRQDINLEVEYPTPIRVREDGKQDFSVTKSFPSLDAAAARVAYGYETLRRLDDTLAAQKAEGGSAKLPADYTALLSEALDDDFNTSRALGIAADLLRYINELVDKKEKPALSKPDRAATLAALREHMKAFSQVLGIWGGDPKERLKELHAKAAKEKGIDTAKVESLIAERVQARIQKDFARGDLLKAEILALGVQLQDRPGNITEWSVL